MIFFFSLLYLITSFSAEASHTWIVGEKSVTFFTQGTQPQTLPMNSIQQTVLDPSDCSLWVQSSSSLLKIKSDLTKDFEIGTALNLLGDTVSRNSFLTSEGEKWQIRNEKGIAFSTFPAPAVFPKSLQGDPESGFWVLDLKEKEKLLELVHFDKKGTIHWKQVVSEKSEIWGSPVLRLDSTSQILWIAFTVTSTDHIYSPRVELWSTSGIRLNSFQATHRGVLFDACLQSPGHLVSASDLPSSPYTAPLFSFLDLFDSSFSPKRIHTTNENWLIPSIQCSSSQVWMLKTSLFGGTDHQLVKWSSAQGEKIQFIFKEPAWKIHHCSL